MLLLRLLTLALMVLAVVLSCSDDGDDNDNVSGPVTPPADTPSFSTEVQPLLAGRCAIPACHGNAGSPTGGMFLGNPPTRATVEGASGNSGAAVVVGNGGASNLYRKTTASPPFGARMPANGPPFLTTEEQDRIKRWIDGGAPDN